MRDWPDPERRYFTVDDMTPYFQSRAREKRICPQCHKATLAVKPTALNPNYAFDFCPKCHYLQLVAAPRAAQVPADWMPPREPHRRPATSCHPTSRAGALRPHAAPQARMQGHPLFAEVNGRSSSVGA